MDRKVTIVTMTYKEYGSLFSTIGSVLAQTYSKIEYIIADDGSDNFPLKEVQAYLEKNKGDNIVSVRYIIRDRNIGTVKNLDDAYRQANGEILMPLSCGDVFYERTTVAQIVEQFEKRSCDVLSASRLVCDEAGNGEYFFPHRSEQKKIERLFTEKKEYAAFLSGYFYDMASGSALYISKSYFMKCGGFDKRFRLWEDGPFIEKALRNHVMVCMPNLIAIKYQLGGVSNGSQINPYMRADIHLYNSEIRKHRMAEIRGFYRKLTRYTMERVFCKNRKQIIKLYLSHPAQVVYRFFYLKGRERAKEEDIAYLRKEG